MVNYKVETFSHELAGRDKYLIEQIKLVRENGGNLITIRKRLGDYNLKKLINGLYPKHSRKSAMVKNILTEVDSK